MFDSSISHNCEFTELTYCSAQVVGAVCGGLRAPEEAEVGGLDQYSHGEESYDETDWVEALKESSPSIIKQNNIVVGGGVDAQVEVFDEGTKQVRANRDRNGVIFAAP